MDSGLGRLQSDGEYFSIEGPHPQVVQSWSKWEDINVKLPERPSNVPQQTEYYRRRKEENGGREGIQAEKSRGFRGCHRSTELWTRNGC